MTSYFIVALGMSIISLFTATTVNFSHNIIDQEEAQPTGQIIYSRIGAGGQTDFVTRTNTMVQIYSVPAGKCAVVSQNGTYIATTSMQTEDLVVRQLDTGRVIQQRTWSTSWGPCNFVWNSDVSLSIWDATLATRHYNFDVLTGMITTFDQAIYVPPTYPQLPNWMTDHPVLQSSNPTKFLYDRCTSGEVQTTPDGTFCKTSPDWVIYDTVRQLAIQILNDVPIEGFVAYNFWGGASWSPDGRYLAYLGNEDFPLQIYDTISNQYINTSGMLTLDVDFQKGILWSPNESKVAVWILGRAGEPQLGDDKYTQKQLVIFNLTQPIGYVIADQPYKLRDIDKPGLWSPDSQTFAFVDQNKSLIYVNTSNGNTATMDTNVEYILTWTSSQNSTLHIIPAPVVETPTATPVVTTTPTP